MVAMRTVPPSPRHRRAIAGLHEARACSRVSLVCSVWGTGQDQMRIVRQRLLEMLPDISVFLDAREARSKPANPF